MTKKNEADTRNGVIDLVERRELSQAVHTEPMRATLGDIAGATEVLREQLADDGAFENVELARQRLSRSVEALRSTVRRSATDLTAALRGTGSCAAAWLRAELGRVRVPGMSHDAVHAP